MDSFYLVLQSTLEITAPVFILMLVGWGLRRSGQIDGGFVQQASGLVFNYGLPLLLFLSVFRGQGWDEMDPLLVPFCILMALLLFAGAWLLAVYFVPERSQRGVFVQGAFRSNLGIVGFALCGQTYAEAGLALGAVVLAVVTPIYNLLSVIVLGYYGKSGGFSFKASLLAIIKNPLIIAILAALVLRFLQIELVPVIVRPMELMAALSLPLALLCIGASLKLKRLEGDSSVVVLSSAYKLLIAPALVLLAGIGLGFSSTLLGVLFLMFASPAATAGYVMVRMIGGDETLAANLITLTSVLSILSISLGIFILRMLGII